MLGSFKELMQGIAANPGLRSLDVSLVAELAEEYDPQASTESLIWALGKLPGLTELRLSFQGHSRALIPGTMYVSLLNTISTLSQLRVLKLRSTGNHDSPPNVEGFCAETLRELEEVEVWIWAHQGHHEKEAFCLSAIGSSIAKCCPKLTKVGMSSWIGLEMHLQHATQIAELNLYVHPRSIDVLASNIGSLKLLQNVTLLMHDAEDANSINR